MNFKNKILNFSLLFFIYFLWGIQITNAQIRVDERVFTTEELIKDVLISSSCSEVSNITTTQGRSLKGIGYFTDGGGDFAFKSGIILSTGDVKNAEGPNRFPKGESEAFSVGDLDLDAAIPALALGQTTDAIFVEFDFVPTTDFISFDFLLASDEYFGDFPCRFSDAFAFLLTDKNNVTTNLAVIPDTNIPIAVTSIHPFVSPLEGEYEGCAAQNAKYFDKITPFNEGEVNFIGQTKVFTAQSKVIPNEKYSIKLVVADALDNRVDTAVFLLEGSFNIGADLGADLTFANGTAICETGTKQKILDPNFIGNNGTYSWQKLNPITNIFETITGANGETYTATTDGTYKVIFSATAQCSFEDTVTIEFVENVPVANNINDIEICDYDEDEKSDFDLTIAKRDLLGSQDENKFNISFHNLQEDADNNLRAIGDRISTNSQKLFARIENKRQPSCYETTSFDVRTIPIDQQQGNNKLSGFGEKIKVCVDESGNLQTPLTIGTPDPSIETYIWESDNDENVASNRNATYLITQLTKPTQYTLLTIPRNNKSCFVYEYTTTIIPIGPPVSINISTEDPIFSSQFNVTATVSENSIGKEFYKYQLNDEEPQDSNVFTGVPAGDYTVKVLAFAENESCSETTSEPIVLISFPKSFSPNGDGINDEWNIAQLSQEPFIIYIYNRFGKLLKTINTQGKGWDGIYNNAPVPSDEYWFVFDYRVPDSTNESLINYKGHFALKR